MFKTFWINRIFATALLFIPVAFFGSPIVQYLTPTELTEKSSGLKEIDAIYVINLDERIAKWKKMQKRLKKAGLSGNRFHAINGWNLSSSAISRLFGHYPTRITKGAVGCLLSHLSVVQDAYQRGFQRIWVMEDDLIFHEKIDQIPDLLKTLSGIDPDWDLFYTDSNSKNGKGDSLKSLDCDFRPDFEHHPKEYYLERTKIDDNILRIRQRFGMYSVIISRNGMKKILDYFNPRFIWSPIDVDIHFVPDLNEYCTIKDMVTFHHQGTIHDTYKKPKTKFQTRISNIYEYIVELFRVKPKEKKSPVEEKAPPITDPWELCKNEAFAKSSLLPGWCSQEKTFFIMDIIRERKFKCIVEIGVFGGSSLFPMLRAVKQVGAGIVYGIDPWTKENAVRGFDELDRNYIWWGQCNLSSVYDSFCQMVQENGFADICKLIRKPANEAAEQFAEGSIDFIHFDGNHSEICSLEDAAVFYPKIKDGGYILLNNPMWETKKKALVFLLERTDCISELSSQAPYLLLRKNIQREINAEKLFKK